ncbi:MAG: hypothetical protein WCW56_00560 [Candidatus Paceibacterota bacterium]|jgi:hypothetical protein
MLKEKIPMWVLLMVVAVLIGVFLALSTLRQKPETTTLSKPVTIIAPDGSHKDAVAVPQKDRKTIKVVPGPSPETTNKLKSLGFSTKTHQVSVM